MRILKNEHNKEKAIFRSPVNVNNYKWPLNGHCMKSKTIILNALLLISILCNSLFTFSQNDTVLNKKRFFLFSGITATTYIGTMLILNELWYKNYSHSSFHFFDDSQEWLQMDKAGHVFSSYYLSSILIKGFNWSKMNHIILHIINLIKNRFPTRKFS